MRFIVSDSNNGRENKAATVGTAFRSSLYHISVITLSLLQPDTYTKTALTTNPKLAGSLAWYGASLYEPHLVIEVLVTH